jgi:hypothetical protein
MNRKLLSPLALIVVTGIGLSVASAQTSSRSATVRPANTRSAAVTSGSGQYYFEFRSRQAWDYGHTFVVFGYSSTLQVVDLACSWRM